MRGKVVKMKSDAWNSRENELGCVEKSSKLTRIRGKVAKGTLGTRASLKERRICEKVVHWIHEKSYQHNVGYTEKLSKEYRIRENVAKIILDM